MKKYIGELLYWSAVACFLIAGLMESDGNDSGVVFGLGIALFIRCVVYLARNNITDDGTMPRYH